jgi:hypothetical protein
MRKPPGATDTPLAHIYPLSKTVGMEYDDAFQRLGVTSIIHDENLQTVDQDNLTELKSIRQLLDFQELVRKAITDTEFDTLFLEIAEMDIEAVEDFPYAVATTEYNYRYPYYQGESDYFDVK